MEHLSYLFKIETLRKGRISRQNYWLFILCTIIIYMLTIIIAYEPGDRITYIFISEVILFFIPKCILTVKRLHDSGKSGKWVFIAIAPTLVGFLIPQTGNTICEVVNACSYIGNIVIIILTLLKGDKEANIYGINSN